MEWSFVSDAFIIAVGLSVFLAVVTVPLTIFVGAARVAWKGGK